MATLSTAGEIDVLLDRRKMRRRVTFWRIFAILALAAALIAALAASGVFEGASKRGPHIARVAISGTITTDRPLIEMLEKIAKDDAVEGVVIAVNSPGGTAVGGEAIYEAVRKVATAKPTVATVDTLAASAGYMVAVGTDHIVARRASIVGSIGVILQYPKFTELLDKIGVDVREVKSSPLKAEPSPFSESPPQTEPMLQRFIDDSYAWFVDLVAERRPFDRATALRLADGSIYSGGQGVANGLIDEIGGEDVALKWLRETRNVDADLKVMDWKPVRPTPSIFGSTAALRAIERLTGLQAGTLGPDDLPAIVPRRLFLDGLLAIWQR